jgi:histidinol-phosphate/aromatic aminotransferase/cobyric acid decarboxylase-like protein
MDLQHGSNLIRLAGLSGRPPDKIVDFSASINPLGPPEWLRPRVSASLGSVSYYSDPDCTQLVTSAAQRYGCPPDEVVVENGSTEILHLFPRALRTRRAIGVAPPYTDFQAAATAAYLMKHRRTDDATAEGYQRGRGSASYVHLHLASRPGAAEHCVSMRRVAAGHGD